MKRYKLIDVRNRKGMDQPALAKVMGVDILTVIRWEDGAQRPHPEMIMKLCDFFAVKYPSELDLHAEFNASTHRREDETLMWLETLDRRELIALFSKLSVFAGMDLTALFSTTVVAPDALLSLCRTTINECWNLLEQGTFSVADSLLTACVSKLDPLATHASPYKDEAASLAAEATIIQMKGATHSMNFSRRVSLGATTICYGELSGDDNVCIMALGWHGDTYTNCYHQPEKAIGILSKAIPLFGNNSRLNQTDISISLATAYALNKNATKAREYAEQAHIAMPENPKLDPLHRLIELGQSELDRREGDMYLILAKHFPQDGFAKMAYDAFEKSMSEQSIDQHNLGYALIHKADAARGVGEMHECLDSLTDGVHIAFQVNNQKGISKAITILQKAPRQWRTEQKYKDLRKLLTPQVIQ